MSRPDRPDRYVSAGGRGPRALSSLLARLTKPALAKRGYAEAALLLDWPQIVGAETAARSRPRRLAFPDRSTRREGTLSLQVEPAFALELQHLEPQLVERINVYFGYRLVARLRLQQAPLAHGDPPKPPRRRRAAAPAGAPSPAATPARDYASIEDPELRDALARLGDAVSGRGRSQSE